MEQGKADTVLFYHAVVVAAVLEGFLPFVEFAAEVHLPGEAKDNHIAVVQWV